MTETAAGAALREARAAWQRGDASAAEWHSRRALELDGGDGRAWTMLGVALRQRDPAEAEAALRRAAVIGPRDPDAHFHLGNLLREQGRAPAAIESYERALALAPDHPSLLNNYALALDAAGAGGRAQAVYRRILEARPDHHQALRNLAHSLCSARRFGEAAAHCAHYLKLHPDGDARVWIDQGICQHAAGDDAAAEASFRRALTLAPGDAVAQTNLASVLIDRGDFAAAEAPLSSAVTDDPHFLYAAALLAYCRQHLCSWDGLAALHARIVRGIEQDEHALVNAFAALSVPMSAANQLRAARRWAQTLTPSEPVAAPKPRSRGSVLRLGYVSSDFRTHAVAFLATEVWERHDRARFETSAYSIAPPEDSPLGRRVAAAFSRFVDCSAEAPDDTAQRIRDDGIDILIDLNGYTTHARSEIFALRPAPVQVSWLGYVGTLGAEWYDYVITDRFATPDDQQAFFTERFLAMPHCCAPSDTRRAVGDRPSREACGLPAEGLVFACFNAPYKILPPVFDVWMRLLREVPDSVLWLSPGYSVACANLQREAVARGVEARRLIFAPRVGLAEHLARHAHADLFVDTLPYNAGTTANDALFMGVPVLTCSGETMASRIAGSQLHAIGLPELVTESLAEYEALALRLAREPASLTALRTKLAANRLSHPLFD
ncbi:MAG TPA: tetratricopeptide repeat protein, partial [Casimicrobiaceae bacterium]|nr:tetratricopeptide repeat protein [Casimicrobiaceae bacterium]